MNNRDKVIKGIDLCLQRFHCGENCPYYNDAKSGCMEQLREDAIVLLNEQEEQIESLKQTVQSMMEGTIIISQPDIVRCKNCKHRGKWERAEDIHGSYSRIVFPDGSLCPGQCEDQFYSWLPPDDWFCANGKRRD